MTLKAGLSEKASLVYAVMIHSNQVPPGATFLISLQNIVKC